MPLLLVPLLLAGLVALWLLLLPLLLWQRYRLGRARQRAIGWAVGANAWLLAASTVGFLAGAWLAQRWIAGTGTLALAGVGAGVLLGMLGTALMRLELTPNGAFHTPNRWLVLLLTGLVAARILLALRQAWLHLRADQPVQDLLAQQGSLFALAGMLLGYYVAYAWGLRRALRASA